MTEHVRSRVAALKEQRDKAIQDIASIPPPSNLVVLDQQSKESMASFDRLIMYCQTQLVREASHVGHSCALQHAPFVMQV